MGIQWQKSSFSTDAEGNCLEVGIQDDVILVRESDAPDMVIRTTRAKLAAFLEGAKAGEFDHFV
ncbi:DUF397 domain-containing protein [Streptomyces lavenduligriseus]|nr:DUF397 domain-containing protein [Streptomyces lavenduligriseus]